MRCRHC
jgi:molecular chaperone GrpE